MKGFTLIEVMIVVVIVAILAAVAVPSYQESIRKSKRTDAREALTRAAAAQERYFFSNNKYAADLKDLGFSSAISSDGYYSLSMGTTECGSATNKYPCYTITATPVAGKAQAKDTTCASFSIDHTGKTTSKDSASPAKDTSEQCW